MHDLQHNPDVLSCLANLSSDEVFTPPEVANAMLDMLPQELWQDSKATFLDPACKSGVFLREIAKRLIEGLKDEIPDLQTRLDHIFQKQLYGIAITDLTALLSRRSLYGSKWANSKYSFSRFDTAEGLIRLNPKLHHTWKNGRCEFCGASQSEYDRSSTLKSHAYEFIHTYTPEKIFKMNDIMQEYPAFIFEDGSYSQDLTVSWNRLVITQKEDDNVVYTYAPFVLTSDGLEFYQPFTLNGKTFTSLVYKDEGEDSYLYSPEYPSVHFIPDYPLNAMFVNNVWYLSFSGLGPVGQGFWQEIIDANSPVGAEKVQYVGFEPYGEGVLDYVWYTNESGFGFSDALMYYELSGKDKVIMEYSGYMGGEYKNFIPDGYATWWSIMLFMSRKQTYTITAVDDPRRPTKIKLTQDDRPTNTIILSKEPIQYPFIN